MAEQAKADRKKASEGRKLQKQAIEDQWKLDSDAHAIKEAAWCVECAAIEAQWKEQRDQARLIHKRAPKKPTLPLKPKRPLKPKEVPVVGVEQQDNSADDTDDIGEDEEELTDQLRDLDLDLFAEMV